MKIRPKRQSENVVDKRRIGQSTGAKVGMGAGGILAIIVALFFGSGALGGGGGAPGGLSVDDLMGALQQPASAEEQPQTGETVVDPDADLALFMGGVLDDVQNTWTEIYAASGAVYEPAKLVLFTGREASGCGTATSQIGPHYCPLDKYIYIDLAFYDELARRFRAEGDFAQAYVLAHEVAHHVQNISGIMDEVRRLQQQYPEDANEFSIRLELQADCLAGVWAYTAYERDLLERGDLEEGLTAAAAVGDDRIQSQANGMVNPETWTHGSSEQRVEWFRVGFDSGDPNACDTFSQGL